MGAMSRSQCMGCMGVVLVVAVCLSLSSHAAAKRAASSVHRPTLQDILRQTEPIPPPALQTTPSGTNVFSLDALLTLYSGMQGASWKYNGNWTRSNYCVWHGIVCDENGEVNQILLADNGLTGTLDKTMFGYELLVVLDLSNNGINGTIPEEVFAMTSLRVLLLSNNNLIGTLPQSIQYLQQLQRLHMSGTNVGGPLPPVVAQLSNLQQLVLGNTYLNGSLPYDWSAMTNLQTLSLVNNLHTGKVPDFSKCVSLQFVDLSWNLFSGSIFDMTRLRNLTYLYLEENEINGTLPPSIVDPPFQGLRVEDNMLSCDLPTFPASFFNQFKKSGDLRLLEGNLFGCPIPSNLDGIDPAYEAYYCGDGIERFVVAALCVAVYLVILALHWAFTARYEDQTRRRDAQMLASSTYTPSKEAATYLDFLQLTVLTLLALSILACVLMLAYDNSQSPYKCRYLLAIAAAFVTETPAIFVGVIHTLFVVCILSWLWLVRRYRRQTWGVWPDPESWLPTTGQAGIFIARGSFTWLRRKAVFAFLSLLIFVVGGVAPNVLYIYVRIYSRFPLGIKQFSGVIVAAYTALVNLTLTHSFARFMVRHFFQPRSKKHDFEVKARLAGWFVVMSSIVSPITAVILAHPMCLQPVLLGSPSETVVVDGANCASYSLNGTCLAPSPATTSTKITPLSTMDARCPSEVLVMYGSVWVTGLVLQGILAPALRLLQDAAQGSAAIRDVLVRCYRGITCNRHENIGIDADDFLVTLVAKYAQIVDALAVVVVAGSVYPLVVPVGMISMFGRWIADRRIVLRGYASGAHERWDPQGARGLPGSAIVLMMVVYCCFLAFFFTFGLLSGMLYWAILLPLVLVGLLIVWLDVPTKLSNALGCKPPMPDGRAVSMTVGGLDSDSSSALLEHDALVGSELERQTSSDRGERHLRGVGGRSIPRRPQVVDSRVLVDERSRSRGIKRSTSNSQLAPLDESTNTEGTAVTPEISRRRHSSTSKASRWLDLADDSGDAPPADAAPPRGSLDSTSSNAPRHSRQRSREAEDMI